jgi:hypothetical protein
MPNVMTHTNDQKHLKWFVTGALLDYFKATGQFTKAEFEKLEQDTMHKVIMYLRGRQLFDASFSDAQADIAYAAKKVFYSELP